MKSISKSAQKDQIGFKYLPSNWIEVNLKEISNSIQYGYTASSTNDPIGPRFLRITDIQDNKVIWDKVPFCIIEEDKKKRYQLKVGDLVFARTGATVGKSYLLKGHVPESVFASYLIKVELNNRISNEFVYYFFQSFEYWKQITEGQVGIGQPNVNGTKLSNLLVPLPPLPEQSAIVGKIEQLFSELDNGIANLKLAQEQLKVYRQAVLKQAFIGELTRKWREEQTNLPDVDGLLEEILKEKERYAKENKIRKKSIKNLSEDEILELQRLPIGWKWVRLGEVSYQIGDVDHKMPKDHPNGIPYVATKDLTNNFRIDFSTAKTISNADYNELSSKIKPEKGDIIFPRYGTIGKNILVDFDKDFLVSYSCAIIKNITKLMNPTFVYQYLFSPDIKIEIRKYTRETTQANVGIASIEMFIFPLCSLLEQQAVVTEIETRLSVCDKLEQDITDALEKAEALRQSILKQAFEGKLLSEQELTAVRNDPEWEPAEALLAKIKSKTI